MSVSFRGPIRAEAFRELLHLLVGRSSHVGLVTPQESMDNRSEALLCALSGVLLEEVEVRSWPGNLVPDWVRPLVLHRYACTVEAVDILFRFCPDLLGWQELALPYDFHALDDRGRVLVGSITSEADAWTDLTVQEWGRWVASTQWLRKVPVEQDPVVPQE